MNTLRTLSCAIAIEIELRNCAMWVMKQGNIEDRTDEMIMPGGREIHTMGEGYRYLKVLKCVTAQNKIVCHDVGTR